jgi:hypothetical protein
VEAPFLTDLDVARISEATGLVPAEYTDTSEILPHVSLTSIRKGADGACVFYRQLGPGCSIYLARPIDCRLYPLDIKVIDDRLTWIVYTSCPDGIFDAGLDWLELARIAETVLLPPLQDQLPVFVSIPTKAFEEGFWRVVGEVRLPMKANCAFSEAS